MKKGKKLIILIKPEFEANYEYVNNGYVNPEFHKKIIDDVIEYAEKQNFVFFLELKQSPILGKKAKNIEYLAYFKR